MMQLSATTALGLLVDADRLGLEQPLRIAAAVDDPGELQQLPEPDHRALDRNVENHPRKSSGQRPAEVDHPFRRRDSLRTSRRSCLPAVEIQRAAIGSLSMISPPPAPPLILNGASSG